MTSFEKNSIIINQICRSIEPGKKMLQKLMYLIGRRGVILDLNYSIHYFGPYSAKLDNTIHTLESYEQINIDTSRRTHVIHPGEVAIEGKLDESDQQKVNFVLENFSKRSAFELEAITTIDYVATEMLKNHGTDLEIIERVLKIKGTKFTKDYLLRCLNILKQFGYAA